MQEDGTVMKERKQGGMRTMPFILGNEICDRFAMVGFNANLITYLTQQLHLPLVEASNTLTNIHGTASFTPIVGAVIADSFAGRFWTITAGSIFYQLGMVSLTVSAVLPGLRPPPCTGEQNLCQRASTTHLAVLYASLICMAIGSGGIRPCVVTFSADQFDLHRRTGKYWNFFDFFFVVMGLAALVALTVVVYIQDNVGWGWGLGIPTIAMFISVLFFVMGYPLYIKLKPGGSPLTRVAQVIVASVRKRKLASPVDPNLLYQDKALDADISVNGRLLHTNSLTFLDRAAIVSEGDVKESGEVRLWRLSTVHRVEELKSINRLLPMWSVGILLTTVSSHEHTFAIQQGRSMDRHVTDRLLFPPASLSVFSILSMLLGLAFYDRAFLPAARRLTGRRSGITCLQRIGVGLAISLLSNVAAALVETQRKKVAAAHGLLDAPLAVVPISIFWLVPQYAISGFAGAFMSVGHMEFLYDQTPESMRSTAAALFWLSGAVGSYAGTVVVTVVDRYTRGGWLQDNINRGKLDYYYWLVTVLHVLNFIYYVFCAVFFTAKPLEMVGTHDNSPSTKVADEKESGSKDGLHV